MSVRIERLHYYEREYLRSFDLAAEQAYHMEMRRRLNLGLHLWGIVEGLDVITTQLAPGGPTQYSVGAGMAIDGEGREIFLFAPYPLTDADLVAARITLPGTYSLWITYDRALATPPAPGYQICNLEDQYTRWRESCRVFIASNQNYAGPAANALPPPTGTLSDDPQAAPWPIRLGSVVVGTSPQGLTITGAVADKRVYVGLRTQRIVPSVRTRSIRVAASLRVDRNAVVGQNFRVNSQQVIPAPTVKPFPGPSGNLKVSSDLFVQRDVYLHDPVNQRWLALPQYVQSLIPEFVVGALPIILNPAGAAGASASGTQTIPVASTAIPRPSRGEILVSITAVHCGGFTALSQWSGALGTNTATDVQLEVTAGTFKNLAPNSNTFDVNWTIGPPSTLPSFPLTRFTLSYVAIFHP